MMIRPSHKTFAQMDRPGDERRTQKCAGWRFTAMTKRPRCVDKPMIEACGPVQIQEFCIGAKVWNMQCGIRNGRTMIVGRVGGGRDTF